MIRTLLFMLILTSVSTVYGDLPSISPDESKVVIRQLEDRTIYEYRIDGELIKIKVVPNSGRPYFLVPSDGDTGRIVSDKEHFLVPQWVLFSW